jgi:hypothetical protein
VANAASGDDLVCLCCGRGFEGNDLAWCSICGEPFHLALRIDVPALDCGQAWISDELEAVQFGCSRCLDPAKPESNSPDAPPGR